MAFGLFLVYLTFSFIRPFELLPELSAYNLMTYLGLSALLAGVVSRLQVQSPVFRNPQLWLIAVFIAWAMFSVVASQRWLGGAEAVFTGLSSSIFICYLVVLTVDRLSRFRTSLRLLTVLAVVISVEGILAYHTGYRREELIVEEGVDTGTSGDLVGSGTSAGQTTVPRIRSRGFLNDPNDLAQALIAILPFVFAARPKGPRVWRALLAWGPTAIMLYAVLLTRSRGGLLALLVVVFLALRDRLPTIVSLVASVSGVLGLLAMGFLGGRATGIDESAVSRTEAWRSGWEMLKGSPLWGVGFGSFNDNHERVAHNSFVHCFSELGLVGYFIWLGILLCALQGAWGLSLVTTQSGGEDEIRGYARACLHSLTAFLVAAFFLSRTYATVLFLLLGLVLALEELALRRRMPIWRFRPLRWLMQVAAALVVSIVFVYIIIRLAP